MIAFRESALAAPNHPLRADYLNALCEAQEMFLEIQIRKGLLIDIVYNDTLSGYAVVDSEKTVLEWYLSPVAVPGADTIFKGFLQEYSIKTAYAKSFDALLVSCAAAHHTHLAVEGFLYREKIPSPDLPLPETIAVRSPHPSDIPAITAINEEVFESDEEIADYVNNKKMHLFYRDSELTGFAIHARVIEGRPEHDVGMLVAAPYRKQGLGKRFLAFAADYVSSIGGRPTMGCAAGNIASRRSIESLGYISSYRMLQFNF